MSERGTGNVLLLSIDAQHVARIQNGTKNYELRKALPRRKFTRVYLFQTGGTGVVGWFDVAEVIRKPIDELWETVGSAATPRKRFRAYFDGFTNGYAIRVARPGQLDVPIRASYLRRVYPDFAAPMSSKLLRVGHPLHEFLEHLRKLQISVRELSIRLEPISHSARRRFRSLVFEEIAPRYDDIDDSFVDGILETHEEGHDPVGFFTSAKEALSIKNRTGKILGFSTVTYKTGGSAKTGPTILLQEYRGGGIGQLVRTALEFRILSKGFRKVYCTAPATSDPVVRYLLKSGYRIEAQLRNQYTERNDELVFGKMLLTDSPELFLTRTSTSASSARVVDTDAVDDREQCCVQLAGLLRHAWFPFDDGAADRIAEEITSDEDVLARKPKEAALLMSGKVLIGAALLLPKRGGSVKGLLISQTGHTPSLERLIDALLAKAAALRGRRVYILHPVGDARTLGILRDRGFLPEGLLCAPYAPGQDVAVYGTTIQYL